MYVVIVYWMTDQPPFIDRFVMLLAISIATSLISQAIGILVSAGVDVQVSRLFFVSTDRSAIMGT